MFLETEAQYERVRGFYQQHEFATEDSVWMSSALSLGQPAASSMCSLQLCECRVSWPGDDGAFDPSTHFHCRGLSREQTWLR